MVTAQISVFTVATGRGAAVLQQLVGEWYGGTITSDRAKAYDSHPLHRRQLCWAHLMRDFQAMIDRGGPGQVVGAALLEHATVLFAWWHWVRDGTWQRSTLQSYVRTLRASFKMELRMGQSERVSEDGSHVSGITGAGGGVVDVRAGGRNRTHK